MLYKSLIISFFIFYIYGLGYAQSKQREEIDWGGNDGLGDIGRYEEYIKYLDSLHIPFAYTILFEKKIRYRKIEEKILTKNKQKVIYSFDSLETFKIVTTKKLFCENTIISFIFNNRKYDIVDLYKKYSIYEKGVPISLVNSYILDFNNKKYLYLLTSYHSNLATLNAQQGCFLFDITNISTISYLPINFPHGTTTPLCFGDIDNNQELDFISLSDCEIEVYRLRNNKFVLNENYYLKIDCVEINHAPVVAYLYLIDWANSKWSYELKDIWKKYR